MSVAKEGPAEDRRVESTNLTGARDELVAALLRESREELERIDLKASILLSVCSLSLAAAVWPRLGKGEEGITYFGHVARFEGLEELSAGLDEEASRHPSHSDHAA